jgi:hypothetical protein
MYKKMGHNVINQKEDSSTHQPHPPKKEKENDLH